MTNSLELHTYPSGPIETNGYLVIDPDSNEALIIDAPSGFAEDVIRFVQDRGVTITAIVITHGHWDHIGDTAALKRELKAPVLTHPNTVPKLEKPGSAVMTLPVDIEPSSRRRPAQRWRHRHSWLAHVRCLVPAWSRSGPHRPDQRAGQPGAWAAMCSSPAATAESISPARTRRKCSTSLERASPHCPTQSPSIPVTASPPPSVKSAPGCPNSEQSSVERRQLYAPNSSRLQSGADRTDVG